MADFIPVIQKGVLPFMAFTKCIGEDGQGCQLRGLVLAGHGDRCMLHGGPPFVGREPEQRAMERPLPFPKAWLPREHGKRGGHRNTRRDRRQRKGRRR